MDSSMILLASSKIITFKSDGYYVTKNDGGYGSDNGGGVVFYKGKLYGIDIEIDTEGNKSFVTSTDDCETLNVNGIIYTKITE